MRVTVIATGFGDKSETPAAKPSPFAPAERPKTEPGPAVTDEDVDDIDAIFSIFNK